jgi:hypothetical protein
MAAGVNRSAVRPAQRAANHGLDSPPLRLIPNKPAISMFANSGARAPLRHTRMVITVRELDDLLREDVRRELEQLHDALPILPSIFTIRFSAAACSAPAGTIRRWPAMPAGITCSAFLAGWRRWAGGDTAYRAHHPRRPAAISLSANHFPPATSPAGASSGTGPRRPATRPASTPGGNSAILQRLSPQSALGIWHRFPQQVEDDPLLRSPLLVEADFLACQADANELLDLAQVDSQKLAASENYPVHKLRKLHSALRQRQLLLPLWLLSWNTLTGDTRDTNGRFFAARC